MGSVAFENRGCCEPLSENPRSNSRAAAKDLTWLPPVILATVTFASLACIAGSQILDSRAADRPVEVSSVAGPSAFERPENSPSAPPPVEAVSAVDAAPSAAAAADGMHFLPKPPSTNHLLAAGRPAFSFVSLPQFEVEVPVGVREEPAVDPRLQEAVRRYAARITELDRERASLVALRADAEAEKTRYERIIEQGEKDAQAILEKIVVCESALATVQTRIAGYEGIISDVKSQSGVTITNDELPVLYRQLALIRIDHEKLRAEVEKIRIRNESAFKHLQTMPMRAKQVTDQAEFLRREWLKDCFDWWGKRTLAENTEAARVFSELLEKDSANPGAKLGRAVALVRLGRTADAMNDLVDADDPSNPFPIETTALRGYLKVLDGSEAKGQAELSLAVTMDRRSIIPLLLRGQALCRQGRYVQAGADFEAAVRIDRTNADAWRYVALCHATAEHHGTRNPRKAGEAADEAVRLTKRANWQALVALAAAEADAGRFDEAAKLAAEAAKLTFDEHHAWCGELEKQFADGMPLRLSWEMNGK